MNGNGESLPEAAARGMEALGIMVIERDELRARNKKLETEVLLMGQKIDQLERILAVCQTERDHYMKHSTEITIRLNDIQIVINEAIRGAKEGAYRPSLTPVPRKLIEPSPEDMAKLESLVAKLPPKGDERDQRD